MGYSADRNNAVLVSLPRRHNTVHLEDIISTRLSWTESGPDVEDKEALWALLQFSSISIQQLIVQRYRWADRNVSHTVGSSSRGLQTGPAIPAASDRNVNGRRV
ncbi:unnamed protein product [Boreogadus saida]